MDHFKHAPVNAHIVHKEHDDDVLVSNFRPELPIYISQDTLQADGLTQDERRLLARHYVEMGRDEKACGLPGGVLVRPSVPATLPKVLVS